MEHCMYTDKKIKIKNPCYALWRSHGVGTGTDIVL